MSKVYLGLGSNLNNPRKQLLLAEQAIARLESVTVMKASAIYRTAPLDDGEGPLYYNQVLEIETELQPLSLLQLLQQVEAQQGRVRYAVRWAPRTIDIDILLYDAMVMNTEVLTIPHYDLHRRVFVLQPLYELAPELVLPSGQKISELLQQVAQTQIEKVE